MKKLLTLCCLLLTSGYIFAQDQVEMADAMRSSGKIYVVVGGLVTIVLGAVLYLIIIDRKVSDIEKRINKK